MVVLRYALGVLIASTIGFAAASYAASRLAFPIRVTSNSMKPYVATGDYGVAVYSRDIRPGDVIVFRFPFGSSELAIKRAVAVAGDCIPPYGGKASINQPGASISATETCALVPPDSAFVLGDNIESSIDSRSFGVVPYREIEGKVAIAIPLTRWWAMATNY